MWSASWAGTARQHRVRRRDGARRDPRARADPRGSRGRPRAHAGRCRALGHCCHAAACSRARPSASSTPSTFGPPPDDRVGALADAAAERLGRRSGDRVGRRAPLDEVLAHRDRDRGLAVGRAGERDDAGAERRARSPPRAGAARSLPRPSWRATSDAALGRAREVARGRGRLLRLEPLQLVLERAHLLDESLDLLGDLLRARRAAARPRAAAAAPPARCTRARRRRSSPRCGAGSSRSSPRSRS